MAENSMAPAELQANILQASALLKTLANEHRLLVLCTLISHSEVSAGALVELTGLSASALSQHLARLRHEKLVCCRREAQTLFYRLADARLIQILQLLKELYCSPSTHISEQP